MFVCVSVSVSVSVYACDLFCLICSSPLLSSPLLSSPLLSSRSVSSELLHLGKEQTKKPWQPVSEEVVLLALALIMDPASYPLAIMCHLGRHRTGTVLGCLRKVQRWNLASIFEEYRRFAGAKVRQNNEEFIGIFDTDLVRVPPQPPKWFK
jgi:hypothetical protein